jgi:CheY-like chemotaxis protein
MGTRQIMPQDHANDIRVLVIDDHKTMREIVRRLLAQIGIEQVSDAENGEAALALLRTAGFEPPDVIICDLHMDKMDGMQFCTKLRHDDNPDRRATPVIILTGEQDTLVHEVTEQVGATVVLTKPISADDLKKQIEAAVGYTI